MDRYVGGVNSFHTADGDALSFVLVFVSRFPKGLGGPVRQTADHSGTARRLHVHNAGQILQTGHQAKVLQLHTNRNVRCVSNFANPKYGNKTNS